MKVVLTHVRSDQSKAIVIPGSALIAVTIVTLLLAAWAGAAWQAGRGAGAVSPFGHSVSSWRTVPVAKASIGAAKASQSALDSALSAVAQSDGACETEYLRENLALLAQRTGALQAQLVTLDSMNQRLIALANQNGAPLQANAAGGLDPLVRAGVPVAASAKTPSPIAAVALHDERQSVDSRSVLGTPSAQDLGRQLDILQLDLTQRAEMLTSLDARLTQRSGAALRWPTASPIADYPYLSSSYGWRRHPITGRQAMHEGLDFSAPAGTRISAAAGGVVTEARHVNGYGNLVEIDHGDGLITRYAHASRLYVKQGQIVKPGQRVASVGSSGLSTGPHLHFEIRLAGQPLDPRLFLPRVLPSGGSFASASQDAG